MPAHDAQSVLIKLMTRNDASVPVNSTIRGVVFEMDLCFDTAAFEFSLSAELSKKGVAVSQKRFQAWGVLPPAERCWKHNIQIGSKDEMWGIAAKPSDFDAGFGVNLHLWTGVNLTKTDRMARGDNGTVSSTSSSTTSSGTSSTRMPTTTTTTLPGTTATTQPTQPPILPGTFQFRNPRMTIYYTAMCRLKQQLERYPGFICNDDGESVVTKPIQMTGKTLIIREQTRLVIQVSGEQVPSPEAYLTVKAGAIEIGNDATVTVRYMSETKPGELKVWRILQAEKGITGAFRNATANAGYDLPVTQKLCFKFESRLMVSATQFMIHATFHDVCLEAVERHPVRAAFIFLGVFGTLLTGFWLLISWRKRQWEQSRRSVLASRIDVDGSDTDDLEMADIRRRDEGYEQAAKLIESREGRFEIGSDEEEHEL